MYFLGISHLGVSLLGIICIFEETSFIKLLFLNLIFRIVHQIDYHTPNLQKKIKRLYEV